MLDEVEVILELFYAIGWNLLHVAEEPLVHLVHAHFVLLEHHMVEIKLLLNGVHQLYEQFRYSLGIPLL